jgi:hypothetical protein
MSITPGVFSDTRMTYRHAERWERRKSVKRDPCERCAEGERAGEETTHRLTANSILAPKRFDHRLHEDLMPDLLHTVLKRRDGRADGGDARGRHRRLRAYVVKRTAR